MLTQQFQANSAEELPPSEVILSWLKKIEALVSRANYLEAMLWLKKAEAYSMSMPELLEPLAYTFLHCGLVYSAKRYLEKCVASDRINFQIQKISEELRNLPQAEKKEVSFYIPAYNAQKYIASCIEGVLAQSYPIKEILVIDDGSQDKTGEIASRYPVKVIRHSKNRGLAACRNTALRYAKADFIASADADVMLDRFCLEYLMGCFNDDNIIGAGGRLIEAYTTKAVDRWRQVNMRQYRGERKNLNPYTICGFTTVYRREVLIKLGGYNERFRTNHEDIDLTIRAKKLKYRLTFEPRAISWHLRQDSIVSLLSTYWRWFVVVRGELLGRFANFNTLKLKAKQNILVSLALLHRSFYFQRFHLIYLDIACGIRCVLEDIIHMERYSGANQKVVKETLLVTFAAFYFILQRKGASRKLLRYILEDMQDLLAMVDKNYRINLRKLKFVFSNKLIYLSDSYPSIKKLFPYAELEFIDDTLGFWIKKFNLESRVWKMVEASAKRMHIEEKQAPEGKGIRIMVLNPPWRKDDSYGVRAGSRWPFTVNIAKNEPLPAYIPFPFFLAYTTALLRKNHFKVVMVDAIAEGLTDEEFLARVLWFKPDIVLIEAATASIFNDLEWARRIKYLVGSTVVFSGPHVSALKEAFLTENPEVDYIIVGEYEFAFLELVKRIRDKRDPLTLEGIGYRTAEGRIMLKGRTKRITRLDSLPFPERLTLPIYNYFDEAGGLRSPIAQILSSRGCPFGCSFCLWPQTLYGNRRYCFRSPRKVVDEIEMLIKEYGFSSFYFDDDTFNIGRDRILEICQEIKRRKLKINWSVMARADAFDSVTLKEMKKAGLHAVKLGVESASQKIIDACGKDLKISKVNQVVLMCKKLGINTHLTFMFGLPKETPNTITRTIDYALKLDPYSVQFSIVTPFFGTRLYDELKKENCLITKDWRLYDGNRFAVHRTKYLGPQELEEALHRAQWAWLEHCQRKMTAQLFGLPFDSRNLIPKDKRRRIAIVDLLYNWPALGGADYDITAVACHLANLGFAVQMFILTSKIPFPRGVTNTAFLVPIQQLFFDKNSFRPKLIAQRFKEAVSAFEPDYVIVADGWGLKPYIVKALQDFPLFLRFYAYENICLIRNGVCLKETEPCPFNFLTQRRECIACVKKFILKNKSRYNMLAELLLCNGLGNDFHTLVVDSLRQAQGVIVYNTKIKELLGNYNKSIYIIPSGVNPQRYIINPLRNDARFNILFAGQTEAYFKGLPILIDACLRIYRKRKDFLLTVTSSEARQEPFIKSVGWVSLEELPQLYVQADICVVPSLWPEPFGIVAVEAMAAGKPVIASRIGGLKDIVVDGVTGFLVEPGDVKQLAEKIELLMDNPDLYKKMGKAARKRVEELYSWPDIIQRYYLPLFR